MTQVNIRMDDDLKARADALFSELGLNMTTAVTMFIRHALQRGGIPFEVTTRPQTSRAAGKSVFGAMKKYANPALLAQEEGAWVAAIEEKYAHR